MSKEMMKNVNNNVVDKPKPDVNLLREDLQTLKEDAKVVLKDAKTLGRDVKTEGRKQLSIAEERAREALEEAKDKGREQYAEIARFIQNNPGQSIAIAFVGGIIVNMLLSRR
jgi:ElaB/YqjD/DUF883 family membrane-anchored ribosome-binding protein